MLPTNVKYGSIAMLRSAHMTPQQLYGLLSHVDSLDQHLSVQAALQSIRDALNNLVSSPAQPNYQTSLASALDAFTAASIKMADSISPFQFAAIQEMGGGEYFAPDIAQKIKDSVQQNAMTPSVARDFVSNLTTRRAEFLATVRSAHQSLEKLGIKAISLQPGAADVAFIIPREMFDNELRSFAKELTFISRLIQDITEARTGKPEPVALEQLSSSIPTVGLIAPLTALQFLGLVINNYLKAWERIEKIRQMREQLAEMRLKGKTALQELTDEIKETVEEVVEDSTITVMTEYKGNRGDLTNAIRSDMRRLFGQIERGLKVEFRTNPKGGDGEDQRILQQIASVGKDLKFPEVSKEPLLLNNGEVFEDAEGTRIIKEMKTTTTRKTTISKQPTDPARDVEKPEK